MSSSSEKGIGPGDGQQTASPAETTIIAGALLEKEDKSQLETQADTKDAVTARAQGGLLVSSYPVLESADPSTVTSLRNSLETPGIDIEKGKPHKAEPQEPTSAESDDEGNPSNHYDRFSPGRKLLIVTTLSFCAFLSPVSSTTILSALPEVAADFNTTGSIISISNAVYMVFMGLSSVLWAPFSGVYGKRLACVSTAFVFLISSIGTAVSPNIAALIIFRILTALSGTAFLCLGPSIIGDLYPPTERGTALGWFLSGTQIGPAIGPLVGGAIVTYTSWRVIFWVQTGLAVVAQLSLWFLLPETSTKLGKTTIEGLPVRKQIMFTLEMINPLRVLKLMGYPNLILVAMASSALCWNQYVLLTPIRYVLNPRFDLTSPIQSGLFFLAPGFGYVVGTFGGGRWADYTVKKWIKKRDGQRIPEDRLRAITLFLIVALPACMLIYGWSVEKAVGGIPVPVIFMFVQGVIQSLTFPALNTYCIDVMPSRSADTIAGNFMTRYQFGAIGSAVVIPAIDGIGVGYFSTISAGFIFLSGVAVLVTVTWGKSWREKLNQRWQLESPSK